MTHEQWLEELARVAYGAALGVSTVSLESLHDPEILTYDDWLHIAQSIDRKLQEKGLRQSETEMVERLRRKYEAIRDLYNRGHKDLRDQLVAAEERARKAEEALVTIVNLSWGDK